MRDIFKLIVQITIAGLFVLMCKRSGTLFGAIIYWMFVQLITFYTIVMTLGMIFLFFTISVFDIQSNLSNNSIDIISYVFIGFTGLIYLACLNPAYETIEELEYVTFDSVVFLKPYQKVLGFLVAGCFNYYFFMKYGAGEIQ